MVDLYIIILLREGARVGILGVSLLCHRCGRCDMDLELSKGGWGIIGIVIYLSIFVFNL